MEKEICVKMVLNAWHSALSQVDKIFTELTNDQLQKEIVPGGNRGIYLLGHFAAVHDQMLPLLVLGQSLFPHLHIPFIRTADKDITDWPSTDDLRNAWADVNAALANGIPTITTNEWFQRHTSVSEQDFSKEPHRNKLNVMISRTNHLQYHLGQLVLLKKQIQ
jgi:hypothetical protein